MMKSLSRSPKAIEHKNVVWYGSTSVKGVSFAVRRPSLASRIELVTRARELTLQYDFLRSGDTSEQLSAALSELLVRKLYAEWGLVEVSGLVIDGVRPTTLAVIERGPEELIDEIIGAIKSESGLTDDERKNS